jgi:hypothetical protein
MEGRSAYTPGAIPSQVSINTRKDNQLSLSLPEYERRIAATVRYKVHLFGQDGGAPGIYGIGPDRRLVGRPLTQLTVAGARGLRASLNLRRDLGRVSFASDYIPVHISGTLSGPRAHAGLHIAVAVNGRVVATGWSFRLAQDKHVYFSSMIPEATLRPGANDVDVLLIGNAATGSVQRLGGT